MTKLEEILAKFEDFELAFIVKYKYDTYLENSKNAITAELKKRNLNKNKIDYLINSHENQASNKIGSKCPRCSSKKTTKDSVRFWNTYGRPGYSDDIAMLDGIMGKETYKEKLTCMVCDYVLHDPNDGGFIELSETISRFFENIFKKKEKKN